MPSALSERDHCHVTESVTEPSGSDTLAVSSTPAFTVPLMVTVPALSGRGHLAHHRQSEVPLAALGPGPIVDCFQFEFPMVQPDVLVSPEPPELLCALKRPAPDSTTQ